MAAGILNQDLLALCLLLCKGEPNIINWASVVFGSEKYNIC